MPESQQTGGERLTTWLVYVLAPVFAGLETISIHSALGGRPAVGAFLALVLVGGMVFVLTRLMPADGRPRLLAHAALIASALALVSVVVLRTRMAEAQGTEPTLKPLVQTALLLLFQTGWALSYWLSAVKQRTDKVRHMPAAIGTVILIGGGLMSGGLERTAPVSEPAVAVFKRFATAEDYAFAAETERAGEESGSAFAHFHTGRQPLLGISFSTLGWMRRERIDSDLMGVFAEDAATEGAHRVVGDPGWVVASVEVQADKHINAIRVQFAAYDGGLVLDVDRYWSKWYGSYVRGEPTRLLDGGAGLVVGLRGSSGRVLNSLSLLIAEQ